MVALGDGAVVAIGLCQVEGGEGVVALELVRQLGQVEGGECVVALELVRQLSQVEGGE